MTNNVSILIKQFGEKFKIESNDSYQSTENSKIITKELPELLVDRLNLSDEYKVYGSVGSGNWSEIPWIGILDKSITNSTTKGYYVVLLLDKNLQNIFLGLAVGWTQFEEEFGVKEGKVKIRAICDHYAKLLQNKPAGFREGLINLNAENNLGKGYERGSVLAKQYSIEDFDDDEFFEDIKTLLSAYQELKETVGNSILNLEIDYSAYDQKTKEFKKDVAKASLNEDIENAFATLISQANTAPPEIKTQLKREIVRNKKFADFIKRKAKHICEICSREPFIQKNGKPYAEADHITPLGGDSKGLDSPDNMRCLCAQCHAVITHGSKEEIEQLIKNK